MENPNMTDIIKRLLEHSGALHCSQHIELLANWLKSANHKTFTSVLREKAIISTLGLSLAILTPCNSVKDWAIVVDVVNLTHIGISGTVLFFGQKRGDGLHKIAQPSFYL